MAQLMWRDPFARIEMWRRRIYPGKCRECGQHKLTPKGRKYVFQYYVEHDAVQSRRDYRGFFCSSSCHDSYHGR